MDRNMKTLSQQAGFTPNKPGLPFTYTLIAAVENFCRILEYQLDFAQVQVARD